jgi:hypothetical protein
MTDPSYFDSYENSAFTRGEDGVLVPRTSFGMALEGLTAADLAYQNAGSSA